MWALLQGSFLQRNFILSLLLFLDLFIIVKLIFVLLSLQEI